MPNITPHSDGLAAWSVKDFNSSSKPVWRLTALAHQQHSRGGGEHFEVSAADEPRSPSI